jgi:tetratricopeptide (TPR) repeat protein
MLSKNKPARILVRVLLVLGVLGIAGFAIYQIPAVNNRLSWRLQIADAFFRGVVDPVKPLPTPHAVQVAVTGASTPTDQPSSIPLTPTATPKTPVPTATPTLTPTAIPGKALIPPPPYEKQDINDCGPATLSMYLQYYGWKGNQATISAEIKPLREDRNVNVEELAYYARTHAGWLQIEYRVQGDVTTLKKLIAAGFPVMIEEGFVMAESYWPNDDRWAGHYLYINGYDDAISAFTTQDVFVGPDHIVSYQDLDKTWEQFNRVYILLFTPDKVDQIKSILGSDWDPDQNRKNAIDRSKQQTVGSTPDAYAWFNLGTNLVYFDRYDEAALAYDQARKIGLPQRMLRYQFGPFISYFNALRTDDLMTLTEYALKITPNSEEGLLWRGWGLYRQGHKQEALDSFQKALDAHPGYPDAVYAMQYVQKN